MTAAEAAAWLLDATEGADGLSLDLWVKDRRSGRVSARRAPFLPPFYVGGAAVELAELARRLAHHPEVGALGFERARSSLFERKPRRLLAVTPARNPLRRRLARSIDALGEFHRFTLFDVDLLPSQLYFLSTGLYPFAGLTTESAPLLPTGPAEAVDYEIPPLTVTPLEIRFAGQGRWSRLPSTGRPIVAIRVGPSLLEGREEDLLRALPGEIDRIDPDVIRTVGGDSIDLPWIYQRAAAAGIAWPTFRLGRAPVPFGPARKARSYATYGRIVHQAASFDLPGRFHLDVENSMLFDDTDLEGLIDAARLSRLSLQTIARQSPGTCFTAMEIAQALPLGVRVPWKKNRPERFRSATHLVRSDRGGTILQPPVGVYDRVEEFDFVSLFPHLMVTKNLSAETLDCRCCPDSPLVAPGIGYRSCTRVRGLIPRTLGPLLERRLAYRALLARPGLPGVERLRYKRRARMLKWILVTAFGYQGYRNARFGRIECHEAINAYAREILAALARAGEEAGYRPLHGIVDSLWLRPREGVPPTDPSAFAERMGRRFGLPLHYEGRYRWIVFLPATTHGFGVPNRYYGRYESGAFKLRGIGARRHDTTPLVRRLELEILDLFGGARSASEVRARLPRALARADLFAAEVARGRWPVEELVIEQRVGTPLAEQTSFRDVTSALRQLAALGLPRAAGERVRFVVLDRRSRAWRDRARPVETLQGNETYDVGAYLELLARGTETLLAPLGVDRSTLLRRWGAPEENRRTPFASTSVAGQSKLGLRDEA